MFLDESGFMLQPLRRRTWAPRGQTPIHYAWDRHDRWSVMEHVEMDQPSAFVRLVHIREPDALGCEESPDL